jgi:hypothetical protein
VSPWIRIWSDVAVVSLWAFRFIDRGFFDEFGFNQIDSFKQVYHYIVADLEGVFFDNLRETNVADAIERRISEYGITHVKSSFGFPL